MPERVEELAPEQAPAARPQAAAPEAATSMPKGPLPGGMSVQQMLSMQQGAGNAAVANFVRGQRRSRADEGRFGATLCEAEVNYR